MPEFTGSYGKKGSSGGPSFTGKAKKKPPAFKGKKPVAMPGGRVRGKPNGGGFTVGGFVQNAAGNLRDMTYGAVPALIESGKAVGGDIAQEVESTVRIVTGQDPPQRLTKPGKSGRRTGAIVKAVGQSYADTYGPLVHGDWRTFLTNVYNDPVFVALDATTLASLGVSGAVRVGVMPAKGGKVLKIVTPSGTTVTKPLAKGELRAQLQSLSAKVAPVRAATKETRKHIARADAARRAEAIRFNRELSRMRSKPERVATFLRAQFDRQALDEQIAVWREAAEKNPNGTEAKTLRIVTNPKVQELFDNPASAKAEAVLSEASELGKKQSAILGVTDKGARTRRYRPAQVAGGARWVPWAKQAADKLEDIHRERVRIDKGRTTHEPGVTRKLTVPRTRADVETMLKRYDDALDPLLEEWTTHVRRDIREGRKGGEGIGIDKYEWWTNRLGKKGTDYAGMPKEDRIRAAQDLFGYHQGEFQGFRQGRNLDPRAYAEEMLSQVSGRPPSIEIDPNTLLAVHSTLVEQGVDMTKLRRALDERDELIEALRRNEPTPDEAFGDAVPREPDYGTRTETVTEPARTTTRGTTPEENARLMELDADQVAALLEQTRRGGSFVGGPSIDELRARGLDPVYMPHTSGTGTLRPYGGQGGGRGIPKTTGNARTNRASLQLAGQLILDPSVLSDSYLRAAKYANYQDVHEALLGMAKPSDSVPRGFVVVRKRRSERVNPRDKYRSEYDEWADEFLDDDAQWKSRDNGLTSNSTADAALSPDGKYLIVPERVAKQLAGEFVQQGKVLRWIEKYPTRVWRTLVLNVRPAYLVNNVFGNTLLYLVHSSKPQDLRELAAAFKQFAKPSEGKQIDRLLDKHFAGQVRGGFIASQGYGGKPGAVGRVRSVFNAIPEMDRRWDQALRRAKVKAELRKHPALREHAERMGSETSYFEKIEGLLDERPDIVNQVYDRVNDALGNFDTMSSFERNKLRALFPFYAWYRAISGVTFKLAIDQPVKANLLARLGEIAVEQNVAASGLSREISGGFIPSGQDEDGRIRGWSTGPGNPWATVGQLGEFAASPARGPGALAKFQPGLGPVPAELYAYITGSSTEGYPADEWFGGRTLEGLPWARLIQSALGRGPQDDTFNDRDILDELLRFAGVPYARRSRSAEERVRERRYG